MTQLHTFGGVSLGWNFTTKGCLFSTHLWQTCPYSMRCLHGVLHRCVESRGTNPHHTGAGACLPFCNGPYYIGL